MESTVILWILAWSGVLSVLIWVARGVLDQLPPLIGSWRRVRATLCEGDGSADPIEDSRDADANEPERMSQK